jgi:hypothetical protein
MNTTPTLSAAQRQQIVANCALTAWQRLNTVLQGLHLPAGTGPHVVATWLEGARPTARAEAQRALLALQRGRWSAESLPATGLPGVPAGAGLGLLLKAGPTTWWLRFAAQPALHVQSIERFVQQEGPR